MYSPVRQVNTTRQYNITNPQYNRISPWLHNKDPTQQYNTPPVHKNVNNTPYYQASIQGQYKNNISSQEKYNNARRPYLLPTPPHFATGGNMEPLNYTYNVPTANRYKALGNC